MATYTNDKEKEISLKDCLYVLKQINKILNLEIENLEISNLNEIAENLYAIRKNIFQSLENNMRYKR